MRRFLWSLSSTVFPKPGEAPDAFDANTEIGGRQMRSNLDADITVLVVNFEFSARFVDFGQIARWPAEKDALPLSPDGVESIRELPHII